MSVSILTGRHLSWLACSLLVLNGPANRVCMADDLPTTVSSELSDLAKAFRGLDKSFQYRGMSSRLASTTGSAFVDWEAKGVPLEERRPVSAPEPVHVGCAGSGCDCRDGECGCGHPRVPQSKCSGCSAECHIPLHGSGSGCVATIGVPVHPRCNDCTMTIGIPLHPHAFSRQNSGCEQGGCEQRRPACGSCRSQEVCGTCDEIVPCHDCFIVEQYRDGRLTRNRVPCGRCTVGVRHD